MAVGEIGVIAAVGRRGQLGRLGRIPWSCPADMKHFKKTTTDCVMIAGGRTYESMRPMFDTLTRTNRVLVRWDGQLGPLKTISHIRTQLSHKRRIWIVGGAYTYRSFAHLVTGEVNVNVIGYDNDPEDDVNHVFFPLQSYGLTVDDLT